jgi:hypothetical protein
LPSDCTTKTSQVGATTVKVTRCVIGPLGAGEEELGTLTWHSAPSGTTTIRTVDQASSPSYDPDSTNNSVSVTKPV